MANRTFYPAQALNKQVKIISGSFAPAGTGAVTAVQGMGFTVARTGVGSFTVTLQDKYIELLSASAQLQLAVGDDKFAQVGASDVVSAKTVVLSVWDISGAAAADVAADPNNRVHFMLVLRNSGNK